MSTKKKSIKKTWSIEGEMTIYTADALKQAFVIKLASTDVLTIDLSKVCEMDSAGFQLLLLARREANSVDKILQFKQPNSAVHEVLSLYHYDLFHLEKAS